MRVVSLVGCFAGWFRPESFHPDLGVGRFTLMRSCFAHGSFRLNYIFLREGPTGWMGKRTDG